jgi:SAM-dependent methyltransferase
MFADLLTPSAPNPKYPRDLATDIAPGYGTTMTDATDLRLADQYEAYPYPARDPRDEAKRLIIGSPSHLREIDHWVFAGRRPRSTPLRALFAGGGTGDGTIMLAQHMARDGRPGRVTHLDRSAAAQSIARARAQARGLQIDFQRGSLLDLATSGLGPFDYIDCCGVLHHLPDPAAGLQALLSVLAPGGGLGLMLYAPHGRTGVYMLQDALRALAPPEDPPASRLDNARRVMRHLPETAWLRRNTYFGDHIDGGDAGLYDLLLNPRDRAYDILRLVSLIDAAGLAITCFMEPMRYDPSAFLPDPKLRARIAVMDTVQRAALAENLAGNMSTHVIYVVRKHEMQQPPDPMDPAAIPVAREMPAAELARNIRQDGVLPFIFDGLRVPVALPPLAAAILRLIDGERTVAAIREHFLARGTTQPAFDRAWRQTFDALSAANRILIAAPAC